MKRFAATLLVLLLLPVVFAGDEPPGPSPAWLGVLLAGSEAGAPTNGVVLGRIVNGSPAEKAGLRARDRILTVDGQAIVSARELIAAVQANDAGSWIPLEVERNGDRLDVRVRLDTRPEAPLQRLLRQGWIGVAVIDLPPELREHFGAPVEAGVMVSKIEEGSPAEAGGFELGDVLYAIDERPVRGAGEMRAKIAGAGVGNVCELTVARGGAELILEVRVEAAPAPRPADER